MNEQHVTIPGRRRFTWAILVATLNIVLGAGNFARGQDFSVPIVSPLILQYEFNPEMAPSFSVQLAAVDLISPELVWSDLLYAVGPGKDLAYPDISAITDPTLSSVGVFQWNLTGWNNGVHLFNAIVTNSRNRSTDSTQVLTVNIVHIPEPTSATCVICASLSIIGLARLGRYSRNQVSLQ